MNDRVTGRLLLGCGALLPLSAIAQRPNIIYIMTDQHAATALSCAGNTDVHTPNIDRLASHGVRFDNAYCAFPLSGPSRAAMFTGYTPSEVGMEENGAPMPDSIKGRTLGTIVRDAGYDCAYSGKWHLNTNSLPSANAFGFKNLHGHDDNGLAEAAVDFLRHRDTSKPFFLVASFNNPHGICEYARHQNPPFGHIQEPPVDDCPQLPANFYKNPYDASVLAFEKSRDQRLYPTWDYTPDDWRRYLNAYYRLIENVDAEIGKIVDEIDRQKLWRNTVVIFTADHGDGAAQHQWNQKTALYESIANIPLIVCLPGGKNAGTVSHQLVNNGEDFMPTVCRLAGIATPRWCKGRSIDAAAGAANGNAPAHDCVVTETNFLQTAGTLGWMVRTRDYKYVLYDSGRNREQLYDMHADRGEMRNLAVERKYKDVLRRHRSLLRQWMDSHPSKRTAQKDKVIPED